MTFTGCQHPARVKEALMLSREKLSGPGPIRITFGFVPVCAECRRILGDVVLSRLPEHREIVKQFSGASWLRMLESHPYPPFNFVRSSNGLMPEGYKPVAEDEVPF